MTDVEPFVALQTDQVGVERRGNSGGERGLADAGFAFEKQRTPKTQGQEQRDGQALVRDVALLAKALA